MRYRIRHAKPIITPIIIRKTYNPDFLCGFPQSHTQQTEPPAPHPAPPPSQGRMYPDLLASSCALAEFDPALIETLRQKIADGLDGDKMLGLLYRGSEHGMFSAEFHSRCDDAGRTLVLVLGTVYGTKQLMGAYCTQPWWAAPRVRTFRAVGGSFVEGRGFMSIGAAGGPSVTPTFNIDNSLGDAHGAFDDCRVETALLPHMPPTAMYVPPCELLEIEVYELGTDVPPA